jgi:hypothetical protein
MFGPVDSWRVRVPCVRCGWPAVVTHAHVADAECAPCLRIRHGAPDVLSGGLVLSRRLGQGGAHCYPKAVVRDVPADVVTAVPFVLDDPGRVPPATLTSLRDAACWAGWTCRVTYSAATLPPLLYAASNRDRAGEVRRPAVRVEVCALRVQRSGAVGYGAWHDGQWAGGAGLDTGFRRFGTQTSFVNWLRAAL